MNIREKMEQAEYANLLPCAAHAAESKGRPRQEEESDVRTCFQRDTDRILHSKAFRRLMHKTQVFLRPSDDHFRTRLTHTLEVTQIARTISRALLLNEDLTEAIGLGHDLGHTPFGHAGERVLNALTGHFKHNEQSLRVVDLLENDGEGLNLTFEVRDGILQHKSSGKPCTLEGKVVSYADRIAYINHDISDAIRAGVLKEEDLPSDCRDFLGTSKGARIDKLVKDIIISSYEKPVVSLSDEGDYYMNKLRDFMFDRVYYTHTGEVLLQKADRMLSMLYKYFICHPDEIPPSGVKDEITVLVCDYLAGMTDNYAINTARRIFLPDYN